MASRTQNAGNIGIQVIPVFNGVGKILSNAAKREGAASGKAYKEEYEKQLQSLKGYDLKRYADATAAQETAVNKLRAAEQELARVRRESNPITLAQAEADLTRAREELDKRSKMLQSAESSLNQLRKSGTRDSEDMARAERFVELQRSRVEKATADFTDAQAKCNFVRQNGALISAEEAEAESRVREAREEHSRVLEKHSKIFEKVAAMEAHNASLLKARDKAEWDSMSTRQKVVTQIRRNVAEMAKEHDSIRRVHNAFENLTTRFRTLRMDLDTSGLHKGISSFNELSFAVAGNMMRLGGLMSILPAVAAAMVPLTAAVIGLVGAFGMLAAGAAAGFGVLMLAIRPLIDGYTALQAQQKQAAMDAQTTAKAQHNAARQIASAKKGVADAARAAAEAVRAAERSEQQAADNVVKAQKNVTQAYKAAAEANERARKQMVDAAKAVRDAEESVADAVQEAAESIERAKQSERDTIESVQEDIERAYESERDAIKKVEDARRDYEREVRDGVRSVQSALDAEAAAYKKISKAQQDAVKAQQALVDARQEAIDQIRELSQDVTDSDLSVRSAEIRVERARNELNQVMMDRSASELDRREAQLAYDEALNNQQKVIRVAEEARAAQAKARAEGIEGNKRVQEALQGIVDANQRVVDAQQEYREAGEKVAEARQRAADDELKARLKVADAEKDAVKATRDRVKAEMDGARQIADARKAVAKAEADAARSIRDSQQRLVEARERLAEATKNVADTEAEGNQRIAESQEALRESERRLAEAHAEVARARAEGQDRIAEANQRLADAMDAADLAANKLTASTNNVNEAMKKLSPEGRQMMQVVMGLSDAMEELSKKAQTAMFPGLIRGMEYLKIYGPGFERLVIRLGATIGSLGEQAGKELSSPVWQHIFSTIGKQLPEALSLALSTFGNFVKGVAIIFTAMSPLFMDIGRSLDDNARSFALWAAEWVKSQSFKDFCNYIRDNGPKVWDLIKSIGRALRTLWSALKDIGPEVIDSTMKVFNWIANHDPEDLERKVNILMNFGKALLGIGAAMKTLKAIDSLYTMAKGLDRVADSATKAAKAVWKFFGKAAPAGVAEGAAAGAAQQAAQGGAGAALSAGASGLLGGAGAEGAGIAGAIASAEGAAAGGGVSGVSGTLLSAAGPAAAIAGGILVVGAAAYVVWKNLDWFKREIDGWIDHLEQKFGPDIQFIMGNMKQIFTTGLSAVMAVATPIWNEISQFWEKVAYPYLERSVKGSFDSLKLIFEGALDIIAGIFKVAVSAITGNWSGLGDGLKQIARGAMEITAGVFQQGVTSITAILGAVLDFTKYKWPALYDLLEAPISFFINTVLAGLVNGWNWIAERVNAPTITPPSYQTKAMERATAGASERTATSVSHGGRRAMAYADGGPIEGYSPTPTADNILIMATAGEHMIRYESAQNMRQRFPGWLEHINAYGRPPGYAEGGIIGMASGGSVSGWAQYYDSMAKQSASFADQISEIVQNAWGMWNRVRRGYFSGLDYMRGMGRTDGLHLALRTGEAFGDEVIPAMADTLRKAILPWTEQHERYEKEAKQFQELRDREAQMQEDPSYYYNQMGYAQGGEIREYKWDIDPGESAMLPPGRSIVNNQLGHWERLTRDGGVTPNMLREALAGIFDDVSLDITGIDKVTGLASAQMVAAKRRRVG